METDEIFTEELHSVVAAVEDMIDGAILKFPFLSRHEKTLLLIGGQIKGPDLYASAATLVVRNSVIKRRDYTLDLTLLEQVPLTMR